MTKRHLIILLVGFNLFLLAAVMLSAYTPDRAFAQEIEDNREYIMIAAQTQKNSDVIYLLDVGNRFLHAFRAGPRRGLGPTGVALFSSRDLKRDFPKARGAGGDELEEKAP